MNATLRGRELLSGAFAPEDRILVLGAGGWFGSTALHLIGSQVTPEQVLGVARSRRLHVVGDWTWQLEVWDEQQVRNFAPTIVLGLAFITRGFAAHMDAKDYDGINMELSRRFIYAASLPSVRLAMTASSGAAITESDHSYGRLKLIEEHAALQLATPNRVALVARAFSVSGPFVRRPAEYAFSSFVEQAASGHIEVKADRPTFRRYSDLGEYLAVCMRRGHDGYSGVIESGGELEEMGGLAQRIAAASQSPVTVHRVPFTSDAPSIYASDDMHWQHHCAALGFEPSSLDDQVRFAMQRERSETKPAG